MNNYLIECLINYILKNYDRYKNEGFQIWLHDNYLRIKYNHKIYITKIIIEENKFYWHLKPYNKSYFLTEIKGYSSFEAIIFAIKDNDNIC